MHHAHPLLVFPLRDEEEVADFPGCERNGSPAGRGRVGDVQVGLVGAFVRRDERDLRGFVGRGADGEDSLNDHARRELGGLLGLHHHRPRAEDADEHHKRGEQQVRPTALRLMDFHDVLLFLDAVAPMVLGKVGVRLFRVVVPPVFKARTDAEEFSALEGGTRHVRDGVERLTAVRAGVLEGHAILLWLAVRSSPARGILRSTNQAVENLSRLTLPFLMREVFERDCPVDAALSEAPVGAFEVHACASW